MNYTHYVIRAYAIILNESQELLISDEYFHGTYMTKFPGGGMESGEGLKDCLLREAMEEFGQAIEIQKHYYTTDFYQKALFYEDAQLISVYYFARFTEPIHFKISGISFDFESNKEGSQSFRWVNVSKMKPDEMTFPIDRKVLELLQKKLPSRTKIGDKR